MRITVFGATGKAGSCVVRQAVGAGHTVKVLVRSAAKFRAMFPDLDVEILEGDVLDPGSVGTAVVYSDAVLFCVGMVDGSPENLCTDATKLILANMKRKAHTAKLGVLGGVGFPVPGDHTSLGTRFVGWFADTFMAKKNSDKKLQYAVLAEETEIDWFLLRPAQIKDGPLVGKYELGYIPYSGMSSISFDDVAHCMLKEITQEKSEWNHKCPIIHY